MRKILFLIGMVAAAAAGCNRSSPREMLKAQVKKEQVNLPPRPDLSMKKAAEKYSDGAMSVDGFVRRARDLVGKEVTVRGYVAAVKMCPPNVERCDIVPHLELTDDLSATRRKVFVVADPPTLFFKDIAEGSRQTLTGTVALWSPDGRLINLDGLLVVKLAVPITK